METTDPGLIVAIVFAAIFGVALLWILIHFGHRYARRQFAEFNHFLEFLHFHLFRKCPCEEYGKEDEENIESQTTRQSPRAASFLIEEDVKDMPQRYSSRRREQRDRESIRGRSPPSPRTTPLRRPSPAPTVNRWRDYPRIQQQAYEAPTGYPMGLQMGPQAGQMAPQMAPRMMGHTMPPIYTPMDAPMNSFMNNQVNSHMLPPMTMPTAPNMAYYSEYGQQCEEQPAQHYPPSETEAAIEASTPQQQDRLPRRVDLIYIADEYPPMVLEAIEQQRAAQAEDTTTVISDGEEIQQIPRAYIPRPAPRAASVFPQLFQYQPYEGNQGRPPRPTADIPHGYTFAPYESTSGQRRKMRAADRRPPPWCERSLQPSLPLWVERRSHPPSLRRSKRSKGSTKTSKTSKPLKHKSHAANEVHARNVQPDASRSQPEHAEHANTGEEPCGDREGAQDQETRAAAESKQEQEPLKEGEPKSDSPVRQADLPLKRVPILLPPPAGLEAAVRDAVVGAEAPGLERKAPSSRAPPSTLISSLHKSELRSPGSRKGSEKRSSQASQEASSHRVDMSNKDGEGTILSSFDGWETERD